MYKCLTCVWCLDDLDAGRLNYCDNEEISDEEYEVYHNKQIEDCPYYFSVFEDTDILPF